MTFLDRKKYIVDRMHVVPSECWEWTRSLKYGYGRAFYAGAEIGAHRFSFESFHGPIPAGMVVMHGCDNPKCVNPEHLSVGTQLENIADSRNKGRGGAYWYPGMENPKCVLDIGKIREIRKLRGKISCASIAAKIGCSKTLVVLIHTGRRWANVI